jgi:hypothetical protein
MLVSRYNPTKSRFPLKIKNAPVELSDPYFTIYNFIPWIKPKLNPRALFGRILDSESLRIKFLSPNLL